MEFVKDGVKTFVALYYYVHTHYETNNSINSVIYVYIVQIISPFDCKLMLTISMYILRIRIANTA